MTTQASYVQIPPPPAGYNPEHERQFRSLVERALNRPALELELPWYDPADYGAATGTDSTDAIQAAINDASAAGGGVVRLRGGTYLISATLELYSNVSLVGDSDLTTVIQVADSAPYFQNVIHAATASNIHVRDITFDANRDNRLATIGTVNVTCGIFFSAVTDVRITRVTVQNTVGGSSGSGVGIAIGGSGNARILIAGCRLISCGISGRASDGVYLGNCDLGLITDCIAEDVWDTGFVLESCQHSGIAGCAFSGGGSPAAISSTTGGDCVGNFINGLTGYDWSAGVSGGIQLVARTGTGRLVDTVLSNITLVRVAGSGPAVRCYRTDSATIVGLTIADVRIDGATLQGVLLEHCSDVLVRGVATREVQGSAIQVDAGCSDVVLDGCHIVMHAAAVIGIVTNGADDVVTQFCKIVGGAATTYGIYHYGTSAQIVDLFNTIRGVATNYIGSDAGTTPVVVTFEETAGGSLSFGKEFRRFVNWNAVGNGFSIDPDQIGHLFPGKLHAASGFRREVDGWTAASTPASQTNVILSRTGGHYTAIRAGTVTGIGLRTSANVTGGTATAKLMINGVAQALTCTISAGSSSARSTLGFGLGIAFAAGDQLSVSITTPAGFTPTAAIPFAALELET